MKNGGKMEKNWGKSERNIYLYYIYDIIICIYRVPKRKMPNRSQIRIFGMVDGT